MVRWHLIDAARENPRRSAATNSQKVRMIMKRAQMMMINMLASLQDAQNRNYRLPTD